MVRVESVKRHETQKKVEKAKQTEEVTKPKSADIKSEQQSERAKDIKRNEEIKDGTFKSRSDATVGDIAQANSSKDGDKVKPEEVKQNVLDIVNNNPKILEAAKNAGINLDDPTEDDVQKLANLDVKAGQEVKVSNGKEYAIDPETGEAIEATEEAQEAKAPEEEQAAKEEGACEGAQEAQAPQAAQGAQAAKAPTDNNNPINQVIDLIAKAESAQDPGQKAQFAQQALGMIEQIRAQQGVSKGAGQQNAYAPGVGQGITGAPGTPALGAPQQKSQVAYAIDQGANIDKSQVSNALKSTDKSQIAQVLDSLESRAQRAANGNSTASLNALNLYGQNQFAMMQAGGPTLPVFSGSSIAPNIQTFLKPAQAQLLAAS